MNRRSHSLWGLLLFPAFTVMTFATSPACTPEGGAGGKWGTTPDEVLIVNSDSTDPAVPLDLSLVVRLFAKERLLEITARVGRHPVFPAELFFSNDVKVNIQLPPGLRLQEGSLSWKGDLKGEQIGEFEAKVRVERDMEGAVDASATGHAPSRIDVDTERFYVQAKGRTIRINLEPFTQITPYQPGAVRPKQ